MNPSILPVVIDFHRHLSDFAFQMSWIALQPRFDIVWNAMNLPFDYPPSFTKYLLE